MAYITQAQVAAAVPRQLIDQALNDDGIGGADSGAWDLVAAAVDAAIDGPLSARFAVPLSAPLPPVVGEAALVFAAELLYQRRGMHGDTNPWTARADKLRARLEKIGDGTLPLSPDTDRKQPGVSAITEDAKTFPHSGRIVM